MNDSHYELTNDLVNIIQQLEKSEPSLYATLSTTELQLILKEFLNRLAAGKTINKTQLSFIFAPAASLQEIALDTGWHDEYVLTY